MLRFRHLSRWRPGGTKRRREPTKLDVDGGLGYNLGP